MFPAFEKLPEESQKRIIDAAARVFAEEGFHHATIANICQEAGISNGALYKYFKNKETLFYTVIDYSTRTVEKLYKNNFLPEKPLFQAIECFLEDLARYSDDNRLFICIYSDLGSSSMNRFAAIAAEKYRTATSRYTLKMIREAREKGEIREAVEPEKAAYLIDTYITIFSYSMVSEYQMNRFHSFFPAEEGEGCGPDKKESMTQLMVSSLQQLLQ